MTKTGHHFTGFISAGLLLTVYPDLSAFGLIACVAGATAPDWLEIVRHDSDGERYSLIPHRTITHWLILWLALAIYCFTFSHELLGAIGFGFAIGGLTHLMFDIPNPSGIPILNPVKNTSLKLWSSGKGEWLALAGYGLLVFLIFTIKSRIG